MKTVSEIHDMMMAAASESPASITHLLDIMVAMLDHIDTLNSRTEIKPSAVPPDQTAEWLRSAYLTAKLELRALEHALDSITGKDSQGRWRCLSRRPKTCDRS